MAVACARQQYSASRAHFQVETALLIAVGQVRQQRDMVANSSKVPHSPLDPQPKISGRDHRSSVECDRRSPFPAGLLHGGTAYCMHAL
jgi:hypothetical protein